MTPDVCIYHADCDDGFAAAFAVWKRYGDSVRFVPAHYGNVPPYVRDKNVLIVDFSYSAEVLEVMRGIAKTVVILDHHKTAEKALKDIPKFGIRDFPNDLEPGVYAHFDMEKSGCRLAWEYCFGGATIPQWMKCIEDRDLWKFELDWTKEVSIAIRSFPRSFAGWNHFDYAELIDEGSAILRYHDEIINKICKRSYMKMVVGYKVPVVHCSYEFVSDAANRLLTLYPDAPFAAAIVTNKDFTSYSLRSDDTRMDVSKIAEEYFGGGHRNAASFKMVN